MTVGANTAAERIYSASSCSDMGFEYGNDTQRLACPYYLFLDSFAKLEDKVAGISEKQKTIATITSTQTVEVTKVVKVVTEEKTKEESVSICSPHVSKRNFLSRLYILKDKDRTGNL